MSDETGDTAGIDNVRLSAVLEQSSVALLSVGEIGMLVLRHLRRMS